MATAIKKYPPHKLALLFPPMNGDDREKTKASIEKNGQLEEVTLLDGQVLDGVNRQDIMVDDLGQQPKYVDYMDLPMNMRAESPFEFVMARNLGRRQLNPSQKAAVATDSIPFFEAEAAERQKAGLQRGKSPSPPTGGTGKKDEFSQDNGHDDADESQVRGGKRGTAAAMAAARMGASERSVQRAARLKKTDPKKFEAVKKGKTTLRAAERDEKKEQAKKDALENAYKRIERVCGKSYAARARDNEFLKSRKEVLAFAGLNDSDMAKCQGLVANGFTVARAAKYKMTALSRTHSLSDLCLRTVQQGGKFDLELNFQGAIFDITVKQRPPEPKL